MNKTGINSIYFIGIGGIGMSAIARYFLYHKVKVFGYDKAQTVLTTALQNEGATIYFEDDESSIVKDVDRVVYTPAIPSTQTILKYYLEHNYTVEKRSKILGEIVADKSVLAVSGSHGKTTTAAILSHLCRTAQWDAASFLGGISVDLASNFQAGDTWAIVEADEYDRSFHSLNPHCALVTAIDSDHLDIYGTLENIKESFSVFLDNVKANGAIILHSAIGKSVVKKSRQVKTYSLTDQQADYTVEELDIVDGKYNFNICHPKGKIENVEFSVGGRHNVENALGAAAIALENGMAESEIVNGISSFSGVKRRFETHLKNENKVLIDDYAHHPNELKAVIESVKDFYPELKLTVIFQPHLYSRTRDFAQEFASALEAAEQIVLTNLYPAREEAIDGISEKTIFDLVDSSNKHMVSKPNLAQFIKDNSVELVLTVGAGDIDQFISSIKNAMN